MGALHNGYFWFSFRVLFQFKFRNLDPVTTAGKDKKKEASFDVQKVHCVWRNMLQFPMLTLHILMAMCDLLKLRTLGYPTTHMDWVHLFLCANWESVILEIYLYVHHDWPILAIIICFIPIIQQIKYAKLKVFFECMWQWRCDQYVTRSIFECIDLSVHVSELEVSELYKYSPSWSVQMQCPKYWKNVAVLDISFHNQMYSFEFDIWTTLFPCMLCLLHLCLRHWYTPFSTLHASCFCIHLCACSASKMACLQPSALRWNDLSVSRVFTLSCLQRIGFAAGAVEVSLTEKISLTRLNMNCDHGL